MSATDRPLLGIRAYVLQGPHGDCSNGGISSHARQVIIVGPGIPEQAPASAEAPAVKVVRRELCGRPYVHLEPVDPPAPGAIGWMASGAYVASSDSRFAEAVGIPHVAIALHDRQETAAQYAALTAGD